MITGKNWTIQGKTSFDILYKGIEIFQISENGKLYVRSFIRGEFPVPSSFIRITDSLSISEVEEGLLFCIRQIPQMLISVKGELIIGRDPIIFKGSFFNIGMIESTKIDNWFIGIGDCSIFFALNRIQTFGLTKNGRFTARDFIFNKSTFSAISPPDGERKILPSMSKMIHRFIHR